MSTSSYLDCQDTNPRGRLSTVLQTIPHKIFKFAYQSASSNKRGPIGLPEDQNQLTQVQSDCFQMHKNDKPFKSKLSTSITLPRLAQTYFPILLSLLYPQATALPVTSHQGGPQLIQQLALTQTGQSGPHSCDLAINRIKEGPADYKSIINAGQRYTDTTFQGYDMIYWTDRPPEKPHHVLSDEADQIIGFYRLSERYPNNKLFGDYGISIQDTAQSQKLGDCYFIAGVVAYAENAERFKKVFVIQEINSSGIMAFNVYVKGMPVVITVDDYLPFDVKDGIIRPIFANIGTDGALWGPLIEKMWAKINGNYERTAAGWQHEALRVLSGAPSQDYLTASHTSDEVWEILFSADRNDYIMGAGTSGTGDHNLRSSIGLSQSHAYSILGAYELVNAQNEVQHRLLRMRNPWRFETYVGKWSDDDVRWDMSDGVSYKKQVPYVDNDDGIFFIDIESFKSSFLYFLVQFYRDDYKVSYYEQLNDDGKLKRYTFSTTKTSTIHVAADTYDPRMYGFNCKKAKVMAQILVREISTVAGQSNPTLKEKYFSDWIGFGHVVLENLPAGDYEIYLQYAWPESTSSSPEFTVRDYTVRVYGPESVNLFDSRGATSVSSQHDTQYWNSILNLQSGETAEDQTLAEMETQITTETSIDYDLLESQYKTRSSGWYMEYSGMSLERSLDSTAVESDRFKLYMFFEAAGKYDLNVQVAFLTAGTPTMIFKQGDETKTSQCQMSPNRGPNGENFYVCPCYIRPLKGIKGCSAIVDNPATSFAYKLHGWNYAAR